jgi:hypothetical protein
MGTSVMDGASSGTVAAERWLAMAVDRRDATGQKGKITGRKLSYQGGLS